MNKIPEVFVSFDTRKTIFYITTRILKNNNEFILVSDEKREGQMKDILNTFCNDLCVLVKKKRWKEDNLIKVHLKRIGGE